MREYAKRKKTKENENDFINAEMSENFVNNAQR